MDRERVIKAIETHINPSDDVGCDQCTYENDGWCMTRLLADALVLLKEQEAEKNKYEYKYDHTDCIWYGSGNCPSTCSQYRDGWNDAMDYIFKDGKGYQPYRRSMK
jgi:hypothetical protein